MITCNECTGQCCKKIVIEIDSPETTDEYLDIFWYIFHPLLHVYLDMDDCWNVEIPSQCKYLQKDGKCSIYDDRPPICDTSKVEDCERNKPDIKKSFRTTQEYAEWLITNNKLSKEKIPKSYL